VPELTDFQIVSYFYNPNIFPKDEFEKRKENWEKVIELIGKKDNGICHYGISRKYPESIQIDKNYHIDFRFRGNDNGIQLVSEKWNNNEWINEIKKINSSQPTKTSTSNDKIRCQLCWEIRLEKTAKKAQELKISYFSTTLLSSPYQDFEKIIKIGKNLARKYNLKFINRDFSQRDPFGATNYRKAQNIAQKNGIYRQKYCGCKYSIDN
jgi:hypothetical protein